MLKYKLSNSDKTLVNGKLLHRIIALKDFCDVREGDRGGYISRPANLSQDGNCWVYDNAKILLGGHLNEDAVIRDNVIVTGGSIFGNTVIMDDAVVTGYPIISGGVIRDRAIIMDGAVVMGSPFISGDSTIRDSATILDNAKIFGSATIGGNALVERNASVFGTAVITDDAIVTGNAKVDNSTLSCNMELVGNGWLGSGSSPKFSPVVFSFSKEFNVTFDGTDIKFGCSSYNFDRIYYATIIKGSTGFHNMLKKPELIEVFREMLIFFYKIRGNMTSLVDRCR